MYTRDYIIHRSADIYKDLLYRCDIANSFSEDAHQFVCYSEVSSCAVVIASCIYCISIISLLYNH